jgi:hypothetical protein
MRRMNSEGIERSRLVDVLLDGRLVREARRRGMCLLCRGRPVSDAGLCEGCLANLTDDELRIATPFIEGTRS